MRAHVLSGLLAAAGIAACAIDVAGTRPPPPPSADAATDAPAPLADGASGDATAPRPGGAVALYLFSQIGGSTIDDVSGVSPLLPLSTDATAKWENGGLHFDASFGHAEARDPTKIVSECKRVGAFSVEAWLTPDVANQTGPARVVTLSRNGSTADMCFTLAVSGTSYVARVRNGGGHRELSTPAGSVQTSLQHVVLTAKARGDARIYVEGSERAREGISDGFDAWTPSWPFAVGGEPNTSDRRLRATVFRVAVYCRELSAGEVTTLYRAGR